MIRNIKIKITFKNLQKMILIFSFLLMVLTIIVMFIYAFENCRRTRIAFFISLGVFLFSIGVNATHDHWKLVSWRNQLVNLKDDKFIEGRISLILGSGEGKIEQKFNYNMYMRTEYGAKLLQLPIDKCRIVYADKPEIETFVKVDIPPTNWKRYFYLKKSNTLIRYDLRVPPNAIDNSFELDAK